MASGQPLPLGQALPPPMDDAYALHPRLVTWHLRLARRTIWFFRPSDPSEVPASCKVLCLLRRVLDGRLLCCVPRPRLMRIAWRLPPRIAWLWIHRRGWTLDTAWQLRHTRVHCGTLGTRRWRRRWTRHKWTSWHRWRLRRRHRWTSWRQPNPDGPWRRQVPRPSRTLWPMDVQARVWAGKLEAVVETDPYLVHPSKRRANSLNRATSKQHGRRHLEQPPPASAVPCKTDTCHRSTMLHRLVTPHRCTGHCFLCRFGLP